MFCMLFAIKVSTSNNFNASDYLYEHARTEQKSDPNTATGISSVRPSHDEKKLDTGSCNSDTQTPT